MCGIVGILGHGAVAGQIVEALKRLEYRGYDFGRHRDARGRPARSAAAPKASSAISNCGWPKRRSPARSASAIPAGRRMGGRPRTMRIPMPAAASPWCITASSRISANCASDLQAARPCLRDRDRYRGRRPSRDRGDAGRPWSERGGRGGLPRLRGAFALAFLFSGEEDLLIGARRGAPLVVGYGEGEMYLGSDALALAPFTDEVTYLEDGDWVILTREKAEFRDASDAPVRSPTPEKPGLRLSDRQGQLPPFHGQGNPRAAGGRRPHARPLSRHVGGRGRGCPSS